MHAPVPSCIHVYMNPRAARVFLWFAISFFTRRPRAPEKAKIFIANPKNTHPVIARRARQGPTRQSRGNWALLLDCFPLRYARGSQ